MDLSTILIISDLQAPAHHQDTIQFLTEIKKQFKPTLVVDIGDLEDFQALNFHGVNPNLPSAHDELMSLRAFVGKMGKLFPDMLIAESNHGTLPLRKARSIGIPDEMLKDARSIIQAPDTWKYFKELVLTLPNGIKCKFKHNFGSNLLLDSQKQGMSIVCGHLHTKANINWWQNDLGMNFSMQVGALVNRNHPALQYAENNSTHPVLTVGIIKGGIPMLIPMIQDRRKRWVGFL